LFVALTILGASERIGAEVTSRTAPSVELRGPKGTPIRLSDFKGQVVLVKFWASWCPQCRETFSSLDAIDREYRSRGVAVLAVNVDEHRKDADAFLNATAHRMRIMFDPRLRAFDAFGGSGVPVTYLIDRRGVIRYAHEGESEPGDATYREELDALLADRSR